MKDTLYYSSLYDYYGDLLTKKQRDYFEDYYFNNFTLQEISENNLISRNAVHKALKDVESKLDFFENTLNLYKNSEKIKAVIKDLDEELKKQIIELI